MRIVSVLLIIWITFSCQKKSIDASEIERIVSNHLENNSLEIERIKRELKLFRINHLDSNISLVKRLEQTHFELIALGDSMDSHSKEWAQQGVQRFYERHFKYGTGLFTSKDMEMDRETPASLLKLHLARLETLFIYDARDDYYHGEVVKFNRGFVFVLPDKTLLKKGEKVTGQVWFGAISSSESNFAIKELLVNGHDGYLDKDGWKFEFAPSVNGKGLTKLELTARILWKDSIKWKDRIFTGNSTVYIEN